jgi:Cu(I)/Ag(I) efflux system periplasmic protein CusF
MRDNAVPPESRTALENPMNQDNAHQHNLPRANSRRHGLVAALGLFVAVSLSQPAAAQEPTLTAGVVRKVDRDTASVTIKHEAIRNLDMGAMTMVFQVRDKSMLDGLQAGDKVMFKVIDVKGKMVIQQLDAVR